MNNAKENKHNITLSNAFCDEKNSSYPFNCSVLLPHSLIKTENYVLLPASYGEKVSLGQFRKNGFDKVSEKFENGALYKYYKTGYSNEAEAEKDKNRAIVSGYPYARVINITEAERHCRMACHPEESINTEEALKIRNIFFGFDRSFLRGESRKELQLLKIILDQHPDYSIEVHAHTDAKGSQEYNEALAKRRQNATVEYLIQLGVPLSRIEKFAHGERKPIAKNTLDTGEDSESGRQLNRRVELKVKANIGILNDVVEEIQVPSVLKL